MSEFAARRAAAMAGLERIDAKDRPAGLIVTHLPNVRYLTGFTGSNAILVLTPGQALLATDPRYDLQAREETDCEVAVYKRYPMLGQLLPKLKRAGLKRWGIEAGHLTVDLLGVLEKGLPKTRFVSSASVVEGLRMVKSADEIERIRRAVRINSEAFEKAVEHLRPGISENFFAAELEFQMRALGAERASFETIVVSGPRSAFVHARPSGDPVLANELLLIDMGAHCEGYASDMTRMVFPGVPGKEVKRRYNAVLEAQLAAIDAVRPGVSSVQVDRAARYVLKKREMDTLFVHSTGHGLGLEIHEPPRVARRHGSKLRAGMVITIEPGV